MRTLAIDCATEACSVALFDEDGGLAAADHRVLGRGHAEHLVPMIAALPGRGRADRILVSLGPGSFTGVRIGIASARALGFAWSAEVLGYPSLALIAAIAIADKGWPGATVCMSGGHGEWFVQDFGAGAQPSTPLQSLTPHDAAARAGNLPLAGSQALALAALLPEAPEALDMLPDAARAHLLGPALLTDTTAPIYGRGPDARLPG